MGVTISTHNGSKVAYGHNIRDEKIVSKEPHIDLSLTHEIWIDEKVTVAYERLFGSAVEEYNAKQSRADRRIDNYYDEICADKVKHPVYEMIIGIYGKNDDGTPICSRDVGKEIMKQFVVEWAERNPNLILIGAYYHADETDAEPHVHLDYIPIAHGYKKGLHTQNGLVKALGEQGFRGGKKYNKKCKETAQIAWEKRENDYFTQLCEARGLTVEHPQIEGRKHLDTAEFKQRTLVERLKVESEQLEADNKQKQAENNLLDSSIFAKRREVDRLTALEEMTAKNIEERKTAFESDLQARKQSHNKFVKSNKAKIEKGLQSVTEAYKGIDELKTIYNDTVDVSMQQYLMQRGLQADYEKWVADTKEAEERRRTEQKKVKEQAILKRKAEATAILETFEKSDSVSVSMPADRIRRGNRGDEIIPLSNGTDNSKKYGE